MDILKTPHQKLLEEAGAVPASPGMVHTPKQMLMNESGIMPRFADGGVVQNQMTPEEMIAELIAANQTPQRFANGGQPEQMSPELRDALERIYDQQTFSGQLPPEPTFQAQPVTATSRTRDAVAKVIGEKPADRLFGTGSEGQKHEYLPLQILNPALFATEVIDLAPQTAKLAKEGDMLGAGINVGIAGLSALPFVKPIKSAIKKIKSKK
jgi:hypothetical protein